MTTEIPLSMDLIALVDDNRARAVAEYAWYAYPYGDMIYAMANFPYRGTIYMINMHRVVLPGIDPVVYINGNGLDNRRENLARNKSKSNDRRSKASGFKGVYWDKVARKWHVRTRFNNKQVHIGYFQDPIKAAQAYDDFIKGHCGPDAYLNFSGMPSSFPAPDRVSSE